MKMDLRRGLRSETRKRIDPCFLAMLMVICFFAVAGCERRQNNQLEISQSSENNIKIGVVTDIHKCEGRIASEIHEEALSLFVQDINKANTSLNVNLGDNISHRVGRCPEEKNSEELLWVLEKIKTNSPMKFVLSDHDINDRQTFDFWKEKTATPRTYYSLDWEGFHLIILDTVTGNGEVLYKCEEDKECSDCERSYEELRKILKDEALFAEYSEQTGKARVEIEIEKEHFKECFNKMKELSKKSRSKESWDKGVVGKEQLEWLRADLAAASNERVIVFSDHPLFYFEKEGKKVYDIVNRSEVQQILSSSGKQVVSICGEAHVWHEEKIDGVQYYIVKSFADPPMGSWALFGWDQEGYGLEKMPSGK